MHPEKIQITLRICASHQNLRLGAFWIAKDAKFLHLDNKDSDQTVHMSEGVLGSKFFSLRNLTFFSGYLFARETFII